tara:strand:+ start:316 stop:519 length:204 start_codon:yes stop_codon:yes gene_type:complete
MIKMDNGTASTAKIFLLDQEDIDLIVRMLHQELDAVHTILENSTTSNLDTWYNRADHCEDLIIQFLK